MGKRLRVFAALIVMSLWIAGCGSGSDKTIVTTADGSAEVSKDGEEITVKTDEGETTIKSNESDGSVEYEATDGKGGSAKVEIGTNKLPDDFPKEIPIPEDSTIVSTVNMSSDEAKGYMVAFTTGLNVEQASDFYRDALNKDGYELAVNTTEAGASLVGENDQYNMLVIVTNDASSDGVTTVSVTLGSKQP